MMSDFGKAGSQVFAMWVRLYQQSPELMALLKAARRDKELPDKEIIIESTARGFNAWVDPDGLPDAPLSERGFGVRDGDG
jgi:hypothetical protein